MWYNNLPQYNVVYTKLNIKYKRITKKKKKNTLKMIFKNAILLCVSLWPEYTQHQI